MTTWYEVFLSEEEEGSHTIFRTDKKEKAIAYAKTYKSNHPDDKVCLDRWELDEQDTPQPIEEIDIDYTSE
jgi:hypothetical protein